MLEEGALYDRWHRTQLSIPGHGDVVLPRDERRLERLSARRHETGFFEALAELHAKHLGGPIPLELMQQLDPRSPEELSRVIVLLRKALGLTAPLQHYGQRDEHDTPPPSEPFTLFEREGAFANGAGTMTSFTTYQLDVREPVRVQVRLTCEVEWSDASWSTLVRAPQGTSLEPLLDAFSEQGLYFRFEQVRDV